MTTGTNADSGYLIVGASLAGARAAETLRGEGYTGPIALIGTEDELPYERPPLSKDYLMGKHGREKLYVHPAEWYSENNVELRLGTTVTSIDPAAHEVTLADGERLPYARLLVTTGSSPRRLAIPGADLGGVLYLRTAGDSDAIRAAFDGASRVAVIGAGWIGLEATAAARAAGVQVSVLEMAELPLLRVLGREVAQVFADLHAANGVDLRFGVQITEITGSDGRADGVSLADGTHIAADVVIVGVGITPNVGLASAAGLAVDNGIVVDAAAAQAMLGQDVSFDRIPYFYTDQYDLGMEYSGYVEPDGYESVVFRGDVPGREFVAFWLAADGRVLAGMNVNIWDVNEAVQALIRSGKPVSADALADPSISLESLAGS